MATYTQSELIKMCMVSTVETLLPNKPEIKAVINNVPLSCMTTTQRVEIIGEEISRSILDEVKESDYFS